MPCPYGEGFLFDTMAVYGITLTQSYRSLVFYSARYGHAVFVLENNFTVCHRPSYGGGGGGDCVAGRGQDSKSC